MPGHVLIISGYGGTDTAAVSLEFPMVIQVRDSLAQIVLNRTVNFASLDGAPGNPQVALISARGANNFARAFSDAIDSQGIVRLDVRLQPLEGTAMVEFTVPEISLADTIFFTITKGQAHFDRAPGGITLPPRRDDQLVDPYRRVRLSTR